MSYPTHLKNRMILMALATVMLLTAGCEQIHSPWVQNGTMQTERDVGMNQQVQLADRLLLGQSDR